MIRSRLLSAIGWPVPLPGRLRPVAVALAAGLSLAACSGVSAPLIALGGATATTINTDKLPTDHIADYITGQDCNSVRQSRDGGPLCRPYEMGVIEEPRYCYKSLGTITCYTEPDPYRDGRYYVQ
ncbi:MAG: hypothetical protein RIM72_01000 [Alphaproteobacteria bacterium]